MLHITRALRVTDMCICPPVWDAYTNLIPYFPPHRSQTRIIEKKMTLHQDFWDSKCI